MDAEGLARSRLAPYRHRTEHEILPWDHLTAGLHKDFLWGDWQTLRRIGREDCRWTPCYDCGVCTGYAIEHVVASPLPPAGGSQGTGQDLARREISVTLMPTRHTSDIRSWRCQVGDIRVGDIKVEVGV
jgi:hypothetical protein